MMPYWGESSVRACRVVLPRSVVAVEYEQYAFTWFLNVRIGSN